MRCNSTTCSLKHVPRAFDILSEHAFIIENMNMLTGMLEQESEPLSKGLETDDSLDYGDEFIFDCYNFNTAHIPS